MLNGKDKIQVINKVWVTSDWHFCHNREFLYGPRGFSNPYDMNEEIVKRHNSLVDMSDDVYVLGDCALNDIDESIALIKRLKGQLHIICGNHDTDNKIDLYKKCWNVVEVVDAKRLTFNGWHFFLSHYPCLCANYDDGKPLKKHCINLCGHTHTKDKFFDWDKGLIYHCEMDAHNCYPVSIGQIIKDCEEKYNAG